MLFRLQGVFEAQRDGSTCLVIPPVTHLKLDDLRLTPVNGEKVNEFTITMDILLEHLPADRCATSSLFITPHLRRTLSLMAKLLVKTAWRCFKAAVRKVRSQKAKRFFTGTEASACSEKLVSKTQL